MDDDDLAPAWDRFASLPFLIFGVGYLLTFPAAIIKSMVDGSLDPIEQYWWTPIAGSALLWLGLRMRRLPFPRRRFRFQLRWPTLLEVALAIVAFTTLGLAIHSQLQWKEAAKQATQRMIENAKLRQHQDK